MSEVKELTVKFAAPRFNPEGNNARHDFVLIHFGTYQKAESSKEVPSLPFSEQITSIRHRSIPITINSIAELRNRLRFRYTRYEDKKPLAEIFVDEFLLDVCILTNLREETRIHFEKAVILKEA